MIVAPSCNGGGEVSKLAHVKTDPPSVNTGQIVKVPSSDLCHRVTREGAVAGGRKTEMTVSLIS